MLVIHIISTKDTREFSGIYEGLDASVLINPGAAIAKAAIKEHDTIMFIGHGNEYGLFNEKLNGYFVDSSWVGLLRDKTVIGIWCYAGNFANRFGLKGFFTSNFISNVHELVDCGFDRFDHADQVIRQENERFSNSLNVYLKNSVPMDRWVCSLQESCSRIPYVQYNYEALYYNK